VKNPPLNTHWAIDPKVLGVYLPLHLSYLVLHVASDNSFCVVGVPDRSYLWVMTRVRPSVFEELGVKVMKAYGVTDLNGTFGEQSGEVMTRNTTHTEQRRAEWSVLETALKRAEMLGFDLSKVQRVPWTEED
jgi:lipocalin